VGSGGLFDKFTGLLFSKAEKKAGVYVGVPEKNRSFLP